MRRIALLLVLLPAAASGAHAQGPARPDVLPVLSHALPRGEAIVARGKPPWRAVTAKVADGAIGDWTGEATRFGGTLRADRGELIYQDHLFDARGADDGKDAERLATLDPLADDVPETQRLDAAIQADIPGQLGLPAAPEQLKAETYYGDLPHQDAADLLELRVAADRDALWVLARTTTMRADDETGLLLLLDTRPGGTARPVPFASGITTNRAEIAVFLHGAAGTLIDLATGASTPLGAVATNSAGWTNAIEARIPRELIGTDRPDLAAATGPATAAGFADKGRPARLANVAFRLDEPPRESFDKKQALALHAGSIDGFFTSADLRDLARGLTQSFAPGRGYHDRIFVSSQAISEETGSNGIHQHYGLYLPASYKAGRPSALQYWLHFRGGRAHTATLLPRIFRHFGEDQDSIVVSPDGRGSSRWYVGVGHQDFREVWDDVLETVSVDRRRVYLSGHSMGGFGSWLLSTLYPDRFAAAMPVAGPVTQGAWTGLDFEGCDDYTYDDYSFCYIQANDGNARDQHHRKLLENLRHVPVAVYQGAADELVPVSGVTRQIERLAELGYRHRYYLFPNYEHYTHPIVDEWAAGARYMHRFRAPRNPSRVTYKRDMRFEIATERSQSNGKTLDFDFDSAYWMSGLEPADRDTGVALFDGRSFAITERPQLTLPEVGGPAEPGQSGPFTMTGLGLARDPLGAMPAARNAFEATLTGASAVTLDAKRMKLDRRKPLEGTVTTDRPLTLTLEWPREQRVFHLAPGKNTL